jgi:hypothetical protein
MQTTSTRNSNPEVKGWSFIAARQSSTDVAARVVARAVVPTLLPAGSPVLSRQHMQLRIRNAYCRSILVEEQLVCNRSMKMEIQEYMLRLQTSNVDTVADSTYLEEDDDTPMKPCASR